MILTNEPTNQRTNQKKGESENFIPIPFFFIFDPIREFCRASDT